MTKTITGKALLLAGTLSLFCAGKTKAQKALNLAGSGNYVETNYSLPGNAAFTIEFDMYMHTLTNFNAGITATCNNIANPIDLYFDASGTLNFFAGQCTSSTPLSVPGHTAGTWYNIAIVHTATGMYLCYVNGVAFSLAGQLNSAQPTEVAFKIGDRSDGATNANAMYDNVKIWSVERTSGEVVSDMTTCFTGSEAGLDILYRMEEGYGSVIYDAALGNGADNGTIVGTASWNAGTGNSITFSTLNYSLCAASYTSPSGNYVWSSSGIYNDTIPNAKGCDSIMTIHLDLTSAVDQAFSPSKDTICPNDSVLITLAQTESGVNYYLRNNAGNVIVDGPKAGTGSNVDLNAGALTLTQTYNVYTEKLALDAVNLPTNSDYVRFNSTFTNFTNAITVEAWYYFDGTNHPYAGQSTFGVEDINTDVWLWLNGTFYVNDFNTWLSVSLPAITDTGWIHIATVADASGLYAYLNGNLVNSSPYGVFFNIQNNSSSVLTIGTDPRYPTTPARNSNMAIDNFRIWNVARTQAEIAASYQSCLTGSETGLVQNLLLNEKNGTAVTSLHTSPGTIEKPGNNNWVIGSGICSDAPCTKQLSGTVTVTVIAAPVVDSVPDITACDSLELAPLNVGNYFYNDNGNETPLFAGNYVDSSQTLYVYESNAGCSDLDSFVVTINASPDITTSVSYETITANATGVTYQWIDCDNGNSLISGETNQSFTASANGNYAVIIDNGNCADTSACVAITTVGLNEISLSGVSVYPNPTQEKIVVTLERTEAVNIVVKNVLGQIITKRSSVNHSPIELNIDAAPGIYFMEITNPENQRSIIRIVKE